MLIAADAKKLFWQMKRGNYGVIDTEIEKAAESKSYAELIQSFGSSCP